MSDVAMRLVPKPDAGGGVTLALLATFGLFFAESLYRLGTISPAPLAVSGCALVLCVIQIRRARMRDTHSAPVSRSELVQLAGLGSAIVSVLCLGFAFGGALFVFFYVRLIGQRRLATACLLALPVPLVVLYLIEPTLKVRMFGGLLFP